MKLHLPKGLLVAVLAAITGFTQSAWGETIELKPLINGEWHETSRYNTNSAKQDLTSISIDSTNGTATLGGGWNQNRATHVLTDWIEADETTALTFSITIGNLTGTGGLSGIAFVGTSQTIALGDLGYDNTKLQYGTSTDVSSDFYLDTGNDWDSYTGGQTTTNHIGDVTIATNTSYTFDGKIVWNANENSYVLSLTLNSAEEPFASVNLGSTADVKSVIVYTDGYGATFSDLTLSGARVSIFNLIWTGTDENNIWSSSNSTPWGGNTSTSEQTNVEFAQLVEGANNTVVISDSVAAHSVTVNDDYTFQADAEASISVESGITVADGKVLNKTGSGTLSIVSSIDGDIKISDGSLNVSGVISGDITVNGGNLNVSGANAISGKKLEISNGTVVATAENSNNASIIANNTEITIKDGGMLKLQGHDMLGWGNTSPAKILLKSENSADDALAKLHFQDTGSTTLASDIEMQGNTLVSGNSINTFGTDFIASGTNNEISIGEIKVRNTLNITVKADGDELLISGNLTGYGSDSQNLIKKGEGTLTLSGTNSYSGGTTVEAGTLIVSEGSSLGTGDVTVNGGNLEVSGENAITATNLNITNGTVTAAYTAGSDSSVISHDTTVNVNAGGTLKLTGHDMLGWSDSKAPAKIVLQGTDENNVATLDIRDNGSFTGAAPIEMKGNSVLTGNVYTTFNGGKITVSEGSNNKITVTEFRARRDVTLDIAKDAVLTIESVICNGNNNEGTQDLTKSNVGTLEITNTKNTWSGKQLNVTGGTLRLVGAANLPGGVTMSAGTRLETGTGAIGNLTMAGNSTLDADTAVTLNGTLTFNGVVNLEGAIKNALYAGEQTVKLFTGITSLVLNGTTYDSTARVAYNPVDLEEVFAFDGLQEDKYQLHYSGGELFASLSVPEPATATLSLLALAGLCARRRRKS